MSRYDHIVAPLKRFERLLIPPALLEDEAVARVVRPLTWLCVTGAVLGAVFVAALAIFLPGHADGMAITLLGFIPFALTLLLIHLKRVNLAVHVFLSAAWVIITISTITTGGARAVEFGLYTLIVITAAMLSGWRTAFVYALITILLGFAFTLLDPDGTILVPNANPVIAWLIQVIIMLLVSGTAYLVFSRSRQDLRRTQHALAELAAAQQSLRESEARFRLIAAATSDFTFSTPVNEAGDPEYGQGPLTGAFEEITGYTLAEFVELGGWRAVLHPDDLGNDIQAEAALRANQPIDGEMRIIKKGGEVRWVRVNALPVWDQKAQRLVGVNGGVQDITERKLTEESVKRNQDHLAALLNASTDTAFLMSRDGTLLTLNNALARSIGKTVEEMINQNAFSFLNPDIGKERHAQFERVAESLEPARWEDRTPIGVWDNSVYPIVSPAGVVEAFAVYSRNITEQRRLEAEVQQHTSQLEKLVDERTIALRRANEQLELVLNNTNDSLAFADASGNILITNSAFRATFTEKAAQSIEYILRSLDDEEQVTSVGESLLKVIYAHESGQIQIHILTKEGQKRDIELTLIPVQTDAENARNGILLHGHDITHMKEIERFKARFVTDALHDLATPISGISTRLYLLQRSPENLENHVRALENQVRHLRHLLEDLRTLAQIDRGQIVLRLDTCNVNELVRAVFDIYEPVALEKQQTLLLCLDPTLPEVQVDSREFERALVNLVSNAVNYTPQFKQININTRLEEQAVVIHVIDQGIGIGADDLPRIFERFYRSDEARGSISTGTGLGLAITKELVEMHGGTITVSSEPENGSTFTIRLPL